MGNLLIPANNRLEKTPTFIRLPVTSLFLFCSKWKDREIKQWRLWGGEFNLFRYATLWIPHYFGFSPKEDMLQPLQCPGPQAGDVAWMYSGSFDPAYLDFFFLKLRWKLGDIESKGVLAGCVKRKQLCRVPGTPSWNMASVAIYAILFSLSSGSLSLYH